MSQRNEPAVFKSSVGVVLKGDTGDSAYEIAVQEGFVGTKEEWLQSLKGEAIKAEAFTQQAAQYAEASQSYAVASGNSATEAKAYRDESQAIKESIAPEADSALAEIRSAKAEAQAMKTQVDIVAQTASTNALQTQADAVEVRYLHQETVRQKNTATDAAERARRYAEGAMAPTLLYYNRQETQELLAQNTAGILVQADEKDTALETRTNERLGTLANELSTQIANSVLSEQMRAEGAETSLGNKIDGDITTLDSTLRQKVDNDLLRYYEKAETYSKPEIDNKIAQSQQRRTVVVDVLPETGEEGVRYLVPSGDVYVEYIYVIQDGTGEFIQIGSQSIDLSNYVTKDRIITMSASQPEYGMWLRPIS